MDRSANQNLLALTTDIVAAHVSNNPVALVDLPHLIDQVYRSLSNVVLEPTSVPERPQPAVAVKKSITPDYIVCLEDGKKLKMLKRHLKTAYNLTPEEYRVRWDLPSDYPMVAPNYARQRSKLAKQIGLGTRGSRPGADRRGTAASRRVSWGFRPSVVKTGNRTPRDVCSNGSCLPI